MNAKAQETDIELEGFGPVDLYQKREKIITRHVGGRFQKLRFYTGWPLLVGYFVAPWLTWDGRQAILFDLTGRRFDLFGLSIWPQDLWLAGWLLMIGALSLFAVTNVVGRVWCGYTCPQTVWTAIYMWLEQKTEGSRTQRMRLDTARWDLNKLRRRVSKHVLWLGVAALTGITFVGYFTPVRELSFQFVTMQFGLIDGWILFWCGFFTLATYVNAGWMREQVCIYMCPYARFQSSMIDRDTLIVSYNPARGEPRGSRRRGAAAHAGQGDCIDCQLCVQVCPTGIDIREGLQYQCIGCAHCVDACNQVMDKMGSPPDLISYTTQAALEGQPIRWIRARSAAYAGVALCLMAAFVYAVVTLTPVELDLLRERGALYTHTDTGIANDYQLKLINKTQHQATLTLSLSEPEWLRIGTPERHELAPGEILDLPLTLSAKTPLPAGTTGHTKVVVRACMPSAQRCFTEETVFIAPVDVSGRPSL